MTRHHQQPGVITQVHDGKMRIMLTGAGGCTTCSKALCVLGETGPKEIEVRAQSGLTTGAIVQVTVKQQTAYLAMTLLYGIPFLLLMSLMWLMIRQGYAEGIAGLAAFASLVLYYIVLYFLRGLFASRCSLNVTGA